EKGLQRAREAVALLSKEPPERLSAANLDILYYAKKSIANMLYALGKYDEGLRTLEELEPLRALLERNPAYVAWARVERMANMAHAGQFLNFAERPQKAIAEFFLPLLESEWARSLGAESSEEELKILANADTWLAGAYSLIDEFEAATPRAAESVRVSELLVERFPRNARYPAYSTVSRAQYGYLLMCIGRTSDSLTQLTRSRAEIDTLASAD